jgi:endoglucanase Acf2
MLGVMGILFCAVLARAEVIQLGQGSYTTDLPAGAKAPPREISETQNVKGKMPSNQWWSSLAWMKYSDRQYPHPLAVQAAAAGLRVSYPGPSITANKTGIFAAMPAPKGEDLLLGHSDVDEFPDAKVDGFGDWFVRARFAEGEKSMTVSYGHGSPFIYATYAGGSARLTFAAAPKVWFGDEKSAVLGITVGGRHYGLFGPTGSTWAGWGTKVLTNQSGGKNYFSVALLSEGDEKTLKLFQKYAYAHVTDTKVAWDYAPKTGTVTTTFFFTTQAYEGDEKGTLFALYPHQWRHSDAKLTGQAYASVRGTMKLAEGTEFKTVMRFPGILPMLPKAEGTDTARMAGYIRAELARKAPAGFRDTYAEGKWLGKEADLASIAEQYGLAGEAKEFHDRVKARLEAWFTAAPGKHSGLFYYDEKWGTMIGYPAGFGSDAELNDHHFHYGYFLRAAAEVVRTQREWGNDQRFGGMVKLLIHDIANGDRADVKFPFLRCFDAYAGHSWASGHARFGDGNNQESSSEAMNAWYGMILWGESTGDTATRDLGIWLYTTELSGIQEYWFDVTGENFPKAYTPAAVGMVWGGKGVFGTWFSGEAEAVYGINYLPVHSGSLYLGLDSKYAARSYQALLSARKGNDWKMWGDIFWMYRALSDPEDAIKQFESGEKRGAEGGNSLANAYHWINCFRALGQIDGETSADWPLAVVFKKQTARTHIAYNAGEKPITVRFSDGFELHVEPGKLAVGK